MELKVNPFPPRLEAYFILFLYFYNEFINKLIYLFVKKVTVHKVFTIL